MDGRCRNHILIRATLYYVSFPLTKPKHQSITGYYLAFHHPPQNLELHHSPCFHNKFNLKRRRKRVKKQLSCIWRSQTVVRVSRVSITARNEAFLNFIFCFLRVFHLCYSFEFRSWETTDNSNDDGEAISVSILPAARPVTSWKVLIALKTWKRVQIEQKKTLRKIFIIFFT